MIKCFVINVLVGGIEIFGCSLLIDWFVLRTYLDSVFDGDVFLAVVFLSLFFCSIGFQMAGNLNDIQLMWCLFFFE